MPDEVVRESDAQPLGSAGLVNQGARETVDATGPAYSAIAAASATAAMEKRETDWHALMGGQAPSAGTQPDGY